MINVALFLIGYLYVVVKMVVLKTTMSSYTICTNL